MCWAAGSVRLLGLPSQLHGLITRQTSLQMTLCNSGGRGVLLCPAEASPSEEQTAAGRSMTQPNGLSLGLPCCCCVLVQGQHWADR